MGFLLRLAWRDLRASGPSIWIFCLCLLLGVSLVATTGSLHRLATASLLENTRLLMGGDLELESRQPLPPAVIEWMRARGQVTRVLELRTMVANATPGRQAESFELAQVQAVDAQYPLYGTLSLQPRQSLESALDASQTGNWGVALDPVLARRLDARPGDSISLGALTLEARALIEEQPDRRLSADWRGPPLLVRAQALEAAKLLQAGSRPEYEYRVRTAIPVPQWRQAFAAAFPDAPWEIRSFADRRDRLARALDRLGSGLLLISYSTLFIGGLGVMISVRSHLRTKVLNIATLRSLGLRDGRLAALYLLQVGMLALGASLAALLLGALLTLLGAEAMAAELPLKASLASLFPALSSALLLGLVTALCFSLPAIGRALAVPPAALFRGPAATHSAPLPPWVRRATLGSAALLSVLIFISLPDPGFGLLLALALGALLGLMELGVRGLRPLTRRGSAYAAARGRFVWHLALAGLDRPSSPLRLSLMALGTALSLVVACTLVALALSRAFTETLPAETPSLVLYDVAPDQRALVQEAVDTAAEGRHSGTSQPTEDSADVAADNIAADDIAAGNIAADNIAADSAARTRLTLAPLVLGRLLAVNGEALKDSRQEARAREARDEHKLSELGSNIDAVQPVAGDWWPQDHKGPALVAMEDREANQLGLQPGDTLVFEVQGQRLEAELRVIYRQRGMQTRFWFEALFSPAVLDPYIHRYVGAAYLPGDEVPGVRDRIAREAPNIISLDTRALLQEARRLLGQASAAIAVMGAFSLGASLLVLAAVTAATSASRVYEANLMQVLGARSGLIRRALRLEFLLTGVLTSLFALATGSALAWGLLAYRLELDAQGLWHWGALVAALTATLALALGGLYLERRLRTRPARLLRG